MSRERSSQNALKHGLCSRRMFVFSNESPDRWNAFLKVWTDKLQPRDEAEYCIVEDIAHAQWRLRRARTYESGLMDTAMEEQAEELSKIYEEVDEGIRQSSAFKSLADNSRSLDVLHRYETRARRAFDRGLTALEKLRALCPSDPPSTEPLSEPETAPQKILPNEIPLPLAALPVVHDPAICLRQSTAVYLTARELASANPSFAT